MHESTVMAGIAHRPFGPFLTRRSQRTGDCETQGRLNIRQIVPTRGQLGRFDMPNDPHCPGPPPPFLGRTYNLTSSKARFKTESERAQRLVTAHIREFVDHPFPRLIIELSWPLPCPARGVGAVLPDSPFAFPV